jgi:hypothetical protein
MLFSEAHGQSIYTSMGFPNPSTRPSNLPSRRAVCPRRHDRAKIDVVTMMTADWLGLGHVLRADGHHAGSRA